MPIEIPLRNDLPFFDLQTVLDDVTYTLEIRWNTRAEAWFMNVLDIEGIVVYQAGLKLVANWMTSAYTTGRNPPGSFFLLDTSGQGEEPGEEDLGDRHKLLYFTASEIGA